VELNFHQTVEFFDMSRIWGRTTSRQYDRADCQHTGRGYVETIHSKSRRHSKEIEARDGIEHLLKERWLITQSATYAETQQKAFQK
jgi:hypothetical protein